MPKLRLGDSPEQFMGMFNNDEHFIRAIHLFEWDDPSPDFATCPRCEKKGKKIMTKRSLPLYQCQSCRKQFNVYCNTPFKHSKTPLKKWFYIYWFYKEGEYTPNEISSFLRLRKMSTKTREIESIILKLKFKDDEIGSEYLWNVKNKYTEYMQRNGSWFR